MSSTHMKMMIAFRRVSTPIAPMVNSTADSGSDSASIDLPPASDHDGPDNGDEQEDARELEREQIVGEKWLRDAADRPEITHRLGVVAGARYEGLREPPPGEHSDLRQQCEPEQPRHEPAPLPSNVRDLRRVSKVQEHHDEQEHHHDR